LGTKKRAANATIETADKVLSRLGKHCNINSPEEVKEKAAKAKRNAKIDFYKKAFSFKFILLNSRSYVTIKNAPFYKYSMNTLLGTRKLQSTWKINQNVSQT
jgi:hypothetical protein